MSGTVRYDKETASKPKVKQSRFAGIKQKYADFLMVDMWYDELAMSRKPSRKIRI